MRITFVRHTEVDVPAGVCYGRTDVALKTSFPDEAAEVRRNLMRLAPDAGVYDGAYTSPLSRCTRLAEVCGYADAVRETSLMELDFGRWEMLRFDEIKDPELQGWYDDWFNTPAGGGESMARQLERVRGFLTRCHLEGKRDIIVFTHAGVILCAGLLAGEAEKENLFDYKPPYGGIVRTDFHPDRHTPQ